MRILTTKLTTHCTKCFIAAIPGLCGF